MSKRRRRSLIGRSPTSDRAPDRTQSKSTPKSLPPKEAADEELDDQEPGQDERDTGESAADSLDESQSDDGFDASNPPYIAPPMLLEDTFPAPKSSRDLAKAEKEDASVDELFDKKVETGNPAPQRDVPGAFPKDFVEEDDWFMKTGQPAPQRVEENPSVAPATKANSSWLVVMGLVVFMGLAGLIGVALILMS